MPCSRCQSRSSSSASSVQRRDQQRRGRSSPRAPTAVAQHHPVGRGEPVDSAAITASTESGRAAVVPVARAMSSSSKRNSTLPPDAARDLLDDVRRQRVLVGRDLDDLGRLPIGERPQRECEAAQIVVVHRSPRGRRIGVCDEEDIPQRAGRPRQANEQIGARLVHELDVLDGQHRRRAAAECRPGNGARRRRACRAGSARRGCSSRASAAGRARAGCRAAAPTERAPRRSGRRPRAAAARLQPHPPAVPAPMPRASARASRNTGSMPRTPRSARRSTRRSGERSTSFLDEPRPAEPGGAADLDDPTVPVPDVVDDVERARRAPRPGRRTAAPRSARPFDPTIGPTIDASDRLRLALGLERLDRRRRERRARALEDDLGRQDLPGLGAWP